MKTRSRYADQYRSTGWVKMLGGPESATVDYAARNAARDANRSARSARMDEILSNINDSHINEKGRR